MGVYDNIDKERFPKQGTFFGKTVEVCFKYDSQNTIAGLIVRDDVEARKLGEHESPGLTIIKLADGRYVLASECQYSLKGTKPFRSVEPGSIDDPQSLAYDLANAPYTFRHIPNNEYLWYEVRCDKEWIDQRYAEWEFRYVNEEEAYNALANKYGAVNIVGKMKPDGSFVPSGFELPEGTLRSIKFKEEQERIRMKRRPRVWEYHTETDTYRRTTKESVKILEYKKPRLTVEAGRQIRAEMLAISESKNSIGGRQFPEWLLFLFDANKLYKSNHLVTQLPEAVMYGDRIFFAIPKDKAKDLAYPDALFPVNYSTVLMAAEQEQMNETSDRG